MIEMKCLGGLVGVWDEKFRRSVGKESCGVEWLRVLP